MHQKREDLDIIFRRTMPEMVLSNIRSGVDLKCNQENLVISINKYSKKAYDNYSLLNLPEYSPTELEMREEAMENSMKELSNGGVFSLLVLYADKVLCHDGEMLTCRLEHVLNWHSIYLRLGQDIFTTAWLAWRNRNDFSDRMLESKFTWPAVLKTDDKKLNHIFKKGLAENHFHLHGSTQSFPISWACLMNHPDAIHTLLNNEMRLKTNLNFNISRGIHDNVYSWEKRILYAAMIRALLFERCLGILSRNGANTLGEAFWRFDAMPLAAEVKRHTEMLRWTYGRKYKQLNNKKACLDYTNCNSFYCIDDEDNNRFLAGERSFLYQCFRRQFRGELSQLESSLLYLYLLIKSNFRGEMVQINNRYGFKNFADYQDRKDKIFEKYDEYWTESLRLSVRSGIQENHLISLEARIMPKESPEAINKYINDLDKRVNFPNSVGEEKQSLPYFYVTHFAKVPYNKEEHENKEVFLFPRNHMVRKKIKQQAKAIDKFMHTYDNRNQRIWGIDACAMEIGCRPETFATEFRYLRECSRDNMNIHWYYPQDEKHKSIGVTYHVGEDFLDIADGLRALDEALQFLCMEKNDRIGHALVLGIDADEYYQTKKHSIYLRKQDYLDNLVWILYRSLELGVAIPENYRTIMTEKAKELLCEIYHDIGEISYTGNLLDIYYQSWKLRGDHPDLYKCGEYVKKINLAEWRYDNYKIAGGLLKYTAESDNLDVYRYNKIVAKMYYLYHFDTKIKYTGFQPASVLIENWYIAIMRDLQHAMRMEVFKRGICIECNPTSNVLIGTFKKYIKHPVITFNNHRLENDNGHLNIPVSINTDDLGVFDTSLENEYAIMFNAICRYRHENDNYNDVVVYEYLDYLRENGISMAFRAVENDTPLFSESDSTPTNYYQIT